ncbi:uncharacterized protein LOC121727273 [Aricia agestis]|uniref:uncharacterized protein LOC121727273 n=1 Tax=Aricia agestis TaxID=91739 RepID=UPI001C20C027|nr:uncharacterized protein LOC121727273 [Aricia agestis]
MNKISCGSGDKIVLVEEIGFKNDEGKVVTKNIKEQNIMVKEFGDKNNTIFFSKKQCEVCASQPNDFYEINKNNEVAKSRNANTNLDADELADVTCRITEYGSILDSLKVDNERKNLQECHNKTIEFESETYEEGTAGDILDDLSYPTNFFTTTVESKLCADKELKEYESQLQSYQRTLNVAQNVKKNAIRKQMLAKAFKLKLLEVENQCNIELLRIKQNLQCLEPLKMIAESWKTEKHEIDLSKYDLSPLYPDILLNTASDINSSKDTQEKHYKNNE